MIIFVHIIRILFLHSNNMSNDDNNNFINQTNKAKLINQY